ncbi:MAG TPA: hypothetical protein DD391_08025 [Clostridiales bacterium]|nr:hypothetical protein [Clostridiales bacterium]HBL82522.1 hypothetical protein [Clostridiales bacterium]
MNGNTDFFLFCRRCVFITNNDSLDWKNLSAADITARVTNRVKPGSVMLFHNGAKNTPEALPQVIEKLQADGFTFVKASDLIYKDNYTIDHSGKQILN